MTIAIVIVLPLLIVGAAILGAHCHIAYDLGKLDGESNERLKEHIKYIDDSRYDNTYQGVRANLYDLGYDRGKHLYYLRKRRIAGNLKNYREGEAK